MCRRRVSIVTEAGILYSFGDKHSMIVTEAGILYSFGDNFLGQLGLGHRDGVNTPHLVAIDAIRSVCAGVYHTAAVTREGCCGDMFRGHRC